VSFVAASNTMETEVISVLATQALESESEMARWEQFEIYQQNGEKWELLGAFSELELAKTMARNRSSRMRLVRSVYDDTKQVEQDVIADLGATRDIA
jgi:hypothetical protein